MNRLTEAARIIRRLPLEPAPLAGFSRPCVKRVLPGVLTPTRWQTLQSTPHAICHQLMPLEINGLQELQRVAHGTKCWPKRSSCRFTRKFRLWIPGCLNAQVLQSLAAFEAGFTGFVVFETWVREREKYAWGMEHPVVM